MKLDFPILIVNSINSSSVLDVRFISDRTFILPNIFFPNILYHFKSVFNMFGDSQKILRHRISVFVQ